MPEASTISGQFRGGGGRIQSGIGIRGSVRDRDVPAFGLGEGTKDVPKVGADGFRSVGGSVHLVACRLRHGLAACRIPCKEDEALQDTRRVTGEEPGHTVAHQLSLGIVAPGIRRFIDHHRHPARQSLRQSHPEAFSHRGQVRQHIHRAIGGMHVRFVGSEGEREIAGRHSGAEGVGGAGGILARQKDGVGDQPEKAGKEFHQHPVQFLRCRAADIPENKGIGGDAEACPQIRASDPDSLQRGDGTDRAVQYTVAVQIGMRVGLPGGDPVPPEGIAGSEAEEVDVAPGGGAVDFAEMVPGEEDFRPVLPEQREGLVPQGGVCPGTVDHGDEGGAFGDMGLEAGKGIGSGVEVADGMPFAFQGIEIEWVGMESGEDGVEGGGGIAGESAHDAAVAADAEVFDKMEDGHTQGTLQETGWNLPRGCVWVGYGKPLKHPPWMNDMKTCGKCKEKPR